MILKNEEKLTNLNVIKLASSDARREYTCSLVSEGFLRSWGGRKSNRYVPSEVLIEALEGGKFDGLAVFVDHPGFFEYPKVERLVAVTRESYWDMESKAVKTTVVFYDRPLANAMANIFDGMLKEDDPPDVGFSLVFWGRYADREEIDDPMVLESISHIESADIVFEPASEARVLEALSVHYEIRERVENENNQLDQMILTDHTNKCPSSPEPGLAKVGDEPYLALRSNIMHESITPIEEGAKFDVGLFRKEVLEAVNTRLDAAVDRFEETLTKRLADDAEDNAIQLGGQPPRGPEIVMGLNGFEELEKAARALLASELPPAGVRPLSGIRELYLLLSGDYEMTGKYNSDRIQFAAVDSSTLANLFADALNKRVIEVGELYPKWWSPAVTIENFNTLQDAKWIVLGGVGELPTVAEGSAYTELTLDDQQESDAFVKKGGYLGVTLEAIDKDDTRKIQAIPRVLARAAWVTLGKAIAAIFTTGSGVGPTMADSVVMFHTTHANLGTAEMSYTAWKATRTAMMKITELNSGERLGPLNAPSLIWTPVDYEYTALQILASMNEPGGADNDVNPEAMDDAQRARLEAARNRVIVCPYWTDTNNWMAQANPMLYPGLGLGYRFGETPEIFSVADPKAGLMFSNDVMPVKVRYFYAVGPIDWRPFYKHNVT